MKRIVLCVVMLLAVSVLCPARAEDGGALLELLADNQNAGGLVPALDPAKLPEELPSVAGKPILVSIHGRCWPYAAKTDLSQVVAEAMKNGRLNYVLLEDDPVYLWETDAGVYYPGHYFQAVHGGQVQTYLQDIMDGTVRQSFLGREYEIQNILCIDGTTNHDGAVVYYITDGGTFVRYYQDQVSSAVELTMEDFCAKATDYYDTKMAYVTSVEVGDGNISFGSYLEDPVAFREKYAPKQTAHWWLIAGGAAVVLTAAVVVFMIRRKAHGGNVG